MEYPMKPFFYCLLLSIMPVRAGFAQSTPKGAPNHRQALYDQYNSYSRKPASSTVLAAPMAPESATNGVEPQQSAGSPTGQSTINTGENERMPEATDPNRPGIRIGFRGGVTYPVFTDNRSYSLPKIGFAGGVTLTFGRGVLSFQPEVNYTRYTVRDNIDPRFGITTFANDYVEVPLFLKIATGTYTGNRFFLNLGPYASYAASTSIDGKKVDISRAKGRFGFGAAAGIGTALRAGPGHITIEVRGLYALGDTDTGFSTNSNTILGQATLGYIVLLGSRH